MKDSSEFVKGAILVLLLTLIGTVGFMVFEHFSFLDALFMTVISMSTVGYGTLHPLSPWGKIFSILFIIISLGVMGYFISQITQHFLKRQFGFFFGQYNRNLKRKKMKNHVIVCGYGRNGSQVVKELIAYKERIVVIDNNHDLIFDQNLEHTEFIEGDATMDEVLIRAGVQKAAALITALPLDADNLYVVLSARALNSNLKIISRASNESAEKKLRMAGVTNVVTPERVGGTHMATLVAQPDVMEFLEYLNRRGNSPVQLTEIICNNLPIDLINKPIKEIGYRKITGANILGFKTASGEYIVNPSPDTQLYPNSKLFVLGTTEQITEFSKLVGGTVLSIEKYPE
ncbi:MAG: potassium channel protein [Bacteroidales bacterium]|nr:potassium channel protein [Bacteroidales bacterium]